jgi:hypothetical protein
MVALAANIRLLVDSGADPKDATRIAAAEVMGKGILGWLKSKWQQK